MRGELDRQVHDRHIVGQHKAKRPFGVFLSKLMQWSGAHEQGAADMAKGFETAIKGKAEEEVRDYIAKKLGVKTEEPAGPAAPGAQPVPVPTRTLKSVRITILKLI